MEFYWALENFITFTKSILNKIYLWKKYAPSINKVQIGYFQHKVQSQGQKTLTLVSTKRVSLVEYAPQLLYYEASIAQGYSQGLSWKHGQDKNNMPGSLW